MYPANFDSQGSKTLEWLAEQNKKYDPRGSVLHIPGRIMSISILPVAAIDAPAHLPSHFQKPLVDTWPNKEDTTSKVHKQNLKKLSSSSSSVSVD